MKSTLAIAAAFMLCGSAFAATNAQQPHKTHGVWNTVKEDAHEIGSSFRQDVHRMARADKFRQEQAADQRRMHSQTTAMGAGPDNSRMSSARDARMDAAYARWQRTHR
ncbi:hypothetical protein HHL11_27390 [Ramlibacter sp. G-1-2-2]|uniref:DUF4148 domain-containing protein n=1 Tax=Ramlibacter agri TaxID=2728837 RepID=A0A848HAJ8_9BURK|nr:hypothetical protein [Ramlibacter agri]NML47504.1 hypothetical protein [Ramlibacter agri]